jgi:arginine N-succinyltransferase
MFVIREALAGDVEPILDVARHLDTVNLPARRDRIERIVEVSLASFAEAVPAIDREYLFVLEDGESKKIVGTSNIHAQHGTRRSPHVFFRVTTDERYSETIDRYMVHQVLQLGYNYNGPTEIGGLILLPEYRGHAESLGKTLSYTRFLFIAMNRDGFRDEVLSELLPPLEADGTSRLWKHFGKRFTGLSYHEADLLSKDNKEFIQSLFPSSLIYTALFPDEVREQIGEVGPATRGVEKILRRIGFRPAGTIDPFDGGPHFVADTDSISLISDARSVSVQVIDRADSGRPRAIVAVTRDESPRFRAVATRLVPADEHAKIGLPDEAARALGVGAGDPVWMTPL